MDPTAQLMQEHALAYQDRALAAEERLEKVEAENKELRDLIRRWLGWNEGSGACSDCEPFRSAPSCIDFVHHRDCGHLEDLQKARAALGQEPLEYHEFEDPKAEMTRLANERWTRVWQEWRDKANKYDDLVRAGATQAGGEEKP